MKVPMKWLRKYTHIALDAQDYAQKMVMSGTGVEGVEKTGADFSNVVVGRVVKMERHPNSDHLCKSSPARRTCTRETMCPWPRKARTCPAG